LSFKGLITFIPWQSMPYVWHRDSGATKRQAACWLSELHSFMRLKLSLRLKCKPNHPIDSKTYLFVADFRCTLLMGLHGNGPKHANYICCLL